MDLWMHLFAHFFFQSLFNRSFRLRVDTIHAWEVVEAKAGKGSATLSMAYSGARFGNKVRHETFFYFRFVFLKWHPSKSCVGRWNMKGNHLLGDFLILKEPQLPSPKKEGERTVVRWCKFFGGTFCQQLEAAESCCKVPFLYCDPWYVIPIINTKTVSTSSPQSLFTSKGCDTSCPGPGRYGRNADRRVCLCCFESHGFAVLLLQGWTGNQKWPWQFFWLQVILVI